MSGIFLALATIHMFVQEKKVGARRHERLLLKKSLFVPATVVRLFREFILKVQLPQQHGQGQCHFGAWQHSSLFSTRCELHGVSALWETWHPLDWRAHLADTTILAPFPFLGKTRLMDTAADSVKCRILDLDLRENTCNGQHLFVTTQGPHLRSKRSKGPPTLFLTELPETTTIESSTSLTRLRCEMTSLP